MQSRRIDQPQPGCFAVRLVRKGPLVPARIVHNESGWTVIVNGDRDRLCADEALDHPGVANVWQGGRQIEEYEYDRLVALRAWALTHQPEHPLCHPYEPINVAPLPPIIPRRGAR